ncbi:MAG: S1C family serine protease [Desulfovibrionaceae bacterium]
MCRIIVFLLSVISIITIHKNSYAGVSIRYTPVVKAVERAFPYVVAITVVKNSKNPKTDDESRMGSGLIINGKLGLIVTSAHVVKDSESIHVRLQDGRALSAKILGVDSKFDIALLSIPANNLPEKSILGNSSGIMLGETAIAIGNPYGFGHSITVGVISATDRLIKTSFGVINDLIQTDAAINPGNSGGPLINLSGKVIAINIIIDARAEGIAFSLPINKVKEIVETLLKHGKAPPLWLGIHVALVDKKTLLLSRVREGAGVRVSHVYPNSPAERAGLKEGDILTSFNGDQIHNQTDLSESINAFTYPSLVHLSILRSSKHIPILLKMSTFKEKELVELLWYRWGISLDETFTDLRVARTTSNNNILLLGDRILSVDGTGVETRDDLIYLMGKNYLKTIFDITVNRKNREEKLYIQNN